MSIKRNVTTILKDRDIGRSKQVQLIFDRWVTKSTPSSFRTRVNTDGVVPSLHVDYKGARLKHGDLAVL